MRPPPGWDGWSAQGWGGWCYLFAAMTVTAAWLGVALALRTDEMPEWPLVIVATLVAGWLWLVGYALRST